MKLNKQAFNIALAENKITYSELAVLCGIVPSTIHRGLNGGKMTTRTIGIIAEQLKVAVEKIIIKEE